MSVFDPTKHIAQPVPRSQEPTQNVLTFYVDVGIDGESGALDEENTLAAIQVSQTTQNLLSIITSVVKVV